MKTNVAPASYKKSLKALADRYEISLNESCGHIETLCNIEDFYNCFAFMSDIFGISCFEIGEDLSIVLAKRGIEYPA